MSSLKRAAPWKGPLRMLEKHLRRNDQWSAVTHAIDRSALKDRARIEEEVTQVIQSIATLLGAESFSMHLVSGDSLLPTRACSQSQAQSAAAAWSHYFGAKDKNGNKSFRLPNNPVEIAVVVRYNDRPYLIVILHGLPELSGDDDPSSYLFGVSDQLSLMVTHFVYRHIRNAESHIADAFFDKKLNPSACWQAVLDSLNFFLPDWSCCKLNPEPIKQLLIFTEGENYLQIVAGHGAHASDSYVLADNSITGQLILDRSLPYIRIDPRTRPDLYKGYGSSITASELAVPLKSHGAIVGVLNLEHTAVDAFRKHYVESVLSASHFLGPYIGALQARYKAYRQKETTLLYVITELLSRMGETYGHLMGGPLYLTRDCLNELEATLSGNVAGSATTQQRLITEIRGLIDDIQKYSDEFSQGLPEFITYGKVEIVSTIKRRLKFFCDRAKSVGVDIRIEPASGELIGYGSSLLQEHIYNLVNNAYQQIEHQMAVHAQDGGTITIQCETECVQDKLGQQTGLRYITIRIVDTGGGAPADVIEKIGEPGFTTKEERGNGFGVAAAKEYFESIGGRMTWRNVDGGFEIQVRVPEFDLHIHREKRLIDEIRKGKVK